MSGRKKQEEAAAVEAFKAALPGALVTMPPGINPIGNGIFSRRVFGDDEFMIWQCVRDTIVETGKLTNPLDLLQAEMAAIYAVQWQRAVMANQFAAADLLHRSLRSILGDLLATKKDREGGAPPPGEDAPANVLGGVMERARERLAEQNAQKSADNTRGPVAP